MEQVECTNCKQKGFTSMGGYYRHLNQCRGVLITGSVPRGILPILRPKTNSEAEMLVVGEKGCMPTRPNAASESFMASMLASVSASSVTDRASNPDGMSLMDDTMPLMEDPNPNVWFRLDPMVFVGDELPETPFMKEHRFVPPKNFSSSYLKNVVNTDGHVCFRQNAWQQLTDKEKSAIGLFKILKGKELYLFDEIQRWSVQGQEGREIEPYSRTKAISDLQKFYGYESLLPTLREVTLPKTGVKVNLTTFSFGEMLLSLLTDPVAMQPENLVLDFVNPYKVPIVGGEDGYFDDFNTGEVHSIGYARYCGEDRSILCEIIMFIDKTHLDEKGKHTNEPVMFTLGIFKRSFRYNHSAWRPLGYIPNIDRAAKYSDVEAKHHDYHACVRVILSEWVAYMRLGGIDWVFAFGDSAVPCRLQIPLNSILCDTEGADKLLGRRLNRREGNLCRICEVPFEELGNPLMQKKWRQTNCSDIRILRNNATAMNKSKLSSLGYRDFHDGLVEVHFSDAVKGLHGATPPEILHMYHMGIEERAIENCFGARKELQRKRKGRKTKKPPPKIHSKRVLQESSEEDDSDCNKESSSDSSDSDEEVSNNILQPKPLTELSQRLVFSGPAKTRVDQLAKDLHSHLKWQSERAMPRTSFPAGITTLTKMQGNERTGVILLLLIIFILEYWSDWRLPGKKGPTENGYLKSAFSEERFANIVKSLGLMLTFQAYIRQDRISQKGLNYVEKFMPFFSDQLLRTFHREEGAGNNTIKNHLLLHVAECIKRFGSLKNVDSGIGESLHKTAVKETGKRTSMRSDLLEYETGTRYVENLTIERSFLDHPSWKGKATSNAPDYVVSNRVMSVTEEMTRWKKEKPKHGLPIWPNSACSPEEVVKVVRSLILPRMNAALEIEIYSRISIKGNPYCAHPCYGGKFSRKQDWAFVDMGEDGVVPNHLLCIIDIPEKPSSPIILNGSIVDDKGCYFLTHAGMSCLMEEGVPPYVGMHQNEGTLAHIDQRIVHRIPKSHLTTDNIWVNADEAHPPSLLLVGTTSIVGPCLAIPDIHSPNSSNEYFVLSPLGSWGELFEESAKEWAKEKPLNTS